MAVMANSGIGRNGQRQDHHNPEEKERFCHASQSLEPQNRTTPKTQKDQIVSSLARKNDESALFYGCLGWNQQVRRCHKKFVAAQQKSLDDLSYQAHIGFVALQQAAGFPGRAGHDR
jgi:hypothetical protein